MAGWLFADLMLVLTVVFLGQVRDSGASLDELPVVDLTTTSTTSTTSTSTTTTVVIRNEVATTTTEPEVEPAVCPGIDPPGDDLVQVVNRVASDDALVLEVQSFLNERIAVRLDERALGDFVSASEVSVGFLLVYAGTPGPTRADESQAKRNAAALVERLEALMPDRFSNLGSRPSFSRNIGPAQARLEYFPRVPQVGISC